jgi:hypothetical protein
MIRARLRAKLQKKEQKQTKSKKFLPDCAVNIIVGYASVSYSEPNLFISSVTLSVGGRVIDHYDIPKNKKPPAGYVRIGMTLEVWGPPAAAIRDISGWE